MTIDTDLISKQQLEVLCYIADYVEDVGYPPSRREISDAMGHASANSAKEILYRMQDRGFLLLTPGASRGIRLTATGKRYAKKCCH